MQWCGGGGYEVAAAVLPLLAGAAFAVATELSASPPARASADPVAAKIRVLVLCIRVPLSGGKILGGNTRHRRGVRVPQVKRRLRRVV